jgi:hypothetical protein
VFNTRLSRLSDHTEHVFERIAEGRGGEAAPGAEQLD